MHPSSSAPHTTVGDSVTDDSPADGDGVEVSAETTVGESVVDVDPEGVGRGASVIPGKPEHSLNASMHGTVHSTQPSSRLLFMLRIEGGDERNVKDGRWGGWACADLRVGGGGGRRDVQTGEEHKMDVR
jgi:hypothetical protein